MSLVSLGIRRDRSSLSNCMHCAHNCSLSLSERPQDEALHVDGNIPFQPWTVPGLFKVGYGQLHFTSTTGKLFYKWKCYAIRLPGHCILRRTASKGIPFNLRGLNPNSPFGSVTPMSWAGVWDTKQWASLVTPLKQGSRMESVQQRSEKAVVLAR